MRALLSVVALLAYVPAAHAASVGGVVRAGNGPVANAIVYLETKGGAPAVAAPADHVVMDQRNLTFVPAVLPVVRGATVDFTNNDDIQHNVFSPSDIANKFDTGTSGPGSVHSVTFDKLGDAVILCNVHMEMEARVVVLAEPYFAVTDAEGEYTIESVPPGSYTAKIWRERFLPERQEVNVPDADRVGVDLQISE